MYDPQFTKFNQPSVTGLSAGYGLFGCGGGLLLGLFGGGILLVMLSLILALNATVTPSPFTSPDVSLTISENFLNRVVQNSMDKAAQVDILPSNLFKIVIDTELSILGVVVPVEISGLFELQLNGQSLQVQLIDTQIAGLTLPPELTDFFRTELPALNRKIDQALQELSSGLGTPLTLTSFSTTDTELQIQARQGP